MANKDAMVQWPKEYGTRDSPPIRAGFKLFSGNPPKKNSRDESRKLRPPKKMWLKHSGQVTLPGNPVPSVT